MSDLLRVLHRKHVLQNVSLRLLVAATTALPSAVHAQPIKTFPVVVETSKKLPARIRTMIDLKKNQVAAQNLIILDETAATAGDVAQAIELVQQIRAEYADNLPRDIRLVPHDMAKNSEGQKNRAGSKFNGALNLLKRQKADRMSSRNGNEVVKRIFVVVDVIPASDVNHIPYLPFLPKLKR